MQQITGKPLLIGALLALVCNLSFTDSRAHIKNEATQFPDIEYSAARFDIVVLVGIGIIPETPVFEPDKALSKAELATWVALARGLKSGGETPDVTALAAVALEQGAIDSLQGDATVDDVNRLFFDGQLQLDDAARTPNKAEAASLIASELDNAAGAHLLSGRNLSRGAGGEVSAVVSAEGHHGGNAYIMTIGGTALPMDEHGRVANGPTDLLQWQGRQVVRSVVRGSGDHASWIYLEAAPRETAVSAAEPVAETATPVEPADRSLLYWLTGAALLLGMALFFRRRLKD